MSPASQLEGKKERKRIMFFALINGNFVKQYQNEKLSIKFAYKQLLSACANLPSPPMSLFFNIVYY